MNVDCEKEDGEPSNRWENERPEEGEAAKHMEKSILQIIYIYYILHTYIYIYIYYKDIINGFEYFNTIQEMHRKKGLFSQFATILL